MTYRLIISTEASKIIAVMDEITHGLFVMAALDLPRDPHGMGRVMAVESSYTTRAHALGGMGMLVYDVDDASSTVTVTDIIWTG